MLEHIHFLKTFFFDVNTINWIETNFTAILVVFGLIIVIIMSTILIIKDYKDIKELNKEIRKKEKSILKLLSTKKNKIS